ncbi:MAG: hypothetical protein IBX48_08860 [Thiomicrospira sp.]|uniref:DUF6502 family protein n=1 Tax=Thiomicrospira sp. TaxID=935 RepID=UPI001A0528D5|nr:DUF6502 family protein [Thiomicrospira sp.]MBE0494438.1 hypothetical protein [Thiomicrospira sp.]
MTSSESSIFIKMVLLVLRPLIRMLLKQGMTYPAFIELVKASYVQVAEQNVAKAKVPTDSLISVQTGLNRKEVKRLRGINIDSELGAKFKQAGIGAQLVSSWLSQPALLDSNGQPKPLARVESADQNSSFEGLVRSVTKDVHPRSILDDWITRGFAQLDENDQVHLTQTAYVPSADQDEQLFFAQKNLSAHLNSVAHNLEAQPGQPVMFDRAVYYNTLSAESIEILHEWSRQASMKLLSDFNLKAQALAQDDQSEHTLFSAHLGVYLYRSDIDSIESPLEASQ